MMTPDDGEAPAGAGTPDGADLTTARPGSGAKDPSAETADATETSADTAAHPDQETSVAPGDAIEADPKGTPADDTTVEVTGQAASTPRVDRDQVGETSGAVGDAPDAVGPDATDHGLGSTEAPREDANAPNDHTALATTPQPQIVEKRGPGFLPLVLGGLLAGAIGYGVPTFLMQDEVPVAAEPPVVDDSRIAAVEAEIAELSSRTASTAAIDESDLEAIQSAQADLSDRLDTFGTRIEELEAQPLTAEAMEELRTRIETLGSDFESLRADVTGRADALGGNVGSLSGSVDALSSEFETLRGDLVPRLESVESQVSEISVRADDVEADAEAQAREAARNQVAIALESGAPFAEPLAVLGTAPVSLFNVAESGVATLAQLRLDFPPLARDALRAARAAETEPGVASLFRNAFNARSLEPREGTDPDAVLSRAQGALDAGNLQGALDEIAALPEDAQSVLADWIERARTRADAVAAADEFLKDG